MTRRSLGFAALVAAASASGCGIPTFAHLDGSDFAPVGQVAEVGTGWVAVDSCSAGVHALVELEITERERTRIQDMLTELGLALAGERVQRPHRVRISGPFCWPAGPRRDQEAGIGDLRVAGTLMKPECADVYVVRAEFELRRVPRSGEAVAVVQGLRWVNVKWAEGPRDR